MTTTGPITELFTLLSTCAQSVKTAILAFLQALT